MAEFKLSEEQRRDFLTKMAQFAIAVQTMDLQLALDVQENIAEFIEGIVDDRINAERDRVLRFVGAIK